MEDSEVGTVRKRSGDKLNTYFKNNLRQAFLILEKEGGAEEDFRSMMLQENEIPGLLKANVQYIDDKSLYRYDISGKMSLQVKHEKTKLTSTDIESLIRMLLELLREIQKYMLEPSNILLSPEYIYCEGDNYYFCYYPLCEQELTEEFHKLTEFLVREVDYKDKEGIHLAYTLHKSSMEDNYSVEKIMDEVLREDEMPFVRYDEHREDAEDAAVIEEKKEIWKPVRRFFGRRKKDKEDEWEEFEDEEDDL